MASTARRDIEEEPMDTGEVDDCEEGGSVREEDGGSCSSSPSSGSCSASKSRLMGERGINQRTYPCVDTDPPS